tara:strand:- start:98 stop:613 length:516 start_codon:yes stop_codon:yes gene_type:complete
MAGQMLNKEFYKLRRDFNPRVVPSVDFIPVPDVPGEIYPEYNMPYPDPFGGELPLDAVKANPRRGSSTDKKEAFQDFLNRGGSQLVAQVPSQMPGAMGGGFNHGIAGNMSDIQQMPYRYGDQGGIQQMPYRGGTPSLIDFGKGLEALKKGKERGGVMNDSTYEALQMLQGY